MSEVTMHQCPTPKEASRYGDNAELDEYDIEDFQKAGVDEVWYWYVSYGYEASGQALMRKDNKWAVHDLGHCSCYGPTCQLTPIEWYDSIDSIKGSEEWHEETRCLVEAASTQKEKE